LESVEIHQEHKLQLTKTEDVMEDLKQEVSSKFQKMKLTCNNHLFKKLMEKRLSQFEIDKNEKIKITNLKNNKLKAKKHEHELNGEDTVELDIKEDYDWNYTSLVF